MPYGKGLSPIAQSCGTEGAEAQAVTLTQQHKLYLGVLADGPLTDREAATALGWLRCTINARRNELVRMGLVSEKGKIKNPETNISNTQWGLV